MKKISIITALLIALILLSACVNKGPVLIPGVTPEPTSTPAPTPEPTEDHSTPEPTEDPAGPQEQKEEYDALGERITGIDHFKRYIIFKDLVVYEEEGDTFLDGVVGNSYPDILTCAVDVVFADADGREIARARLQTRDGSYLLTLAPGDTVVLARIFTDMTLTAADFTLEFDMETGVKPLVGTP